MRRPHAGRARVRRRIAAGCMLVASLSGAAPARAGFEAAVERLQRGDFANALPELRALARDGDVRAQDTLAGLYRQGIGVERDVAEAMGWYCRVAHHRSGGTQVMHAVWYLAEYFSTGGGVPGPGYNDGRPGDENPLPCIHLPGLREVHCPSQLRGRPGRDDVFAGDGHGTTDDAPHDARGRRIRRDQLGGTGNQQIRPQTGRGTHGSNAVSTI